MQVRHPHLWLLSAGVGLLLLTPVSARATPLLEDDGETLGLTKFDTPEPGPWDSMTLDAAKLNAVRHDALGAHRGGRGIWVHDVDPSAAGNQALLTKLLSPALTGQVYFRTWLQLRSSNAEASMVVFSLRGAGNTVVLQLGESFSTQLARIGAQDRSGFVYDPGFSGLQDGAWHLLEVELLGLGSATGEHQLWMDGVSVVHRTSVDSTGFVATRLQVGEPGSFSSAFTGTIYYDDVRLDTVPLVSRVSLTSAVTAPASSCAASTPCVPVTVGMVDMVGKPTSFPYATQVDLAVGQVVKGVGGATFFKDAACSAGNGLIQVSLGAGASSATVYVKPSACGIRELRASQTDFLPGTSQLVSPGNAVALSVVSAPQNVAPGVCSQAVKVQTVDSSGTSAAAAGAVNVVPSAVGLRFFSDAACRTELDAPVLLLADGSGAFSFQADSASAVTLQVAASGRADLASATQRENTGLAKAVLQLSATQITAGTGVTLDARGSTPSLNRDAAGGVATLAHFEWQEPEGPAFVSLADTSVVSAVLGAPGTYRFRLSVVDSTGSRSLPVEVRVEVPGDALPGALKLGCREVGGGGWLPVLLSLGGLAALRKRRPERS